MSYRIDFNLATSDQIETALCTALEAIRLSRNITQAHLAREAGVSVRTVGRLENGEGVSLDTFVRVLKALRIEHRLETLLPDPTVRPMERVGIGTGQRLRARPTSAATRPGSGWAWGDGEGNDDE